MLACVDTHYRPDAAVVACVVFHEWADAVASREIVRAMPPAGEYVSGAFYRRELPPLQHVSEPLDAVIVDGYAWLGSRPGRGAHLHRAMGSKVAVVGVAKSPFRSAIGAIAVTRGKSAQPLFVTAEGMGAVEAAERVRSMHGPHRLPTLLRRVDQLCRGS